MMRYRAERVVGEGWASGTSRDLGPKLVIWVHQRVGRVRNGPRMTGISGRRTGDPAFCLGLKAPETPARYVALPYNSSHKGIQSPGPWDQERGAGSPQPTPAPPLTPSLPPPPYTQCLGPSRLRSCALKAGLASLCPEKAPTPPVRLDVTVVDLASACSPPPRPGLEPPGLGPWAHQQEERLGVPLSAETPEPSS